MIGETCLLRMYPAWRPTDWSMILGDSNARGQGYGTEAALLMLDYAFGYLNFHRVAIGVVGFNSGALRFYERLGFQPEGIQEQGYFFNHAYHDFVMMRLLEDEFREKWRKDWQRGKNKVEYWQRSRQAVGKETLLLPGAAGAILNDGKILLVRHNMMKKWQTPGELQEVGESIQQTVEREIHEELGLDLTAGPLIAVYKPSEMDRRISERKGPAADILLCHGGQDFPHPGPGK